VRLAVLALAGALFAVPAGANLLTNGDFSNWDGPAKPAGGLVYCNDVEFVQGLVVSEGRPTPQAYPADLRVAPSPVIGSGAVSLSLARAARVQVDLYDMAGCRVAGIFDGDLPPGDHSFAFSGLDRGGRPLAAGLYFVVVSDDSGRGSVRKIVFEP
jgi:hypothetical protein